MAPAAPHGSEHRGRADDRPGHPMMASILLVVGVSVLIVLLAVASSL